MMHAAPHVYYRIIIQGILDPRWSEWFDGLAIECSVCGITTLTGPVRDQAALHGLLIKIRDLGLPLLAVQRIDANAASS